MIDRDVFEAFERGALMLSHGSCEFDALPWHAHAVFEGVELKHIVTSQQSGGFFSYHLVRIAPEKRIGLHVHEAQLETHEVIAGSGICRNDGVEFAYEAGRVAIFPAGIEHEIQAGKNGLFLFAKFFPALC